MGCHTAPSLTNVLLTFGFVAQVHASRWAGSYATSCFPAIMNEMETQLTGYGLGMMEKQMVAGANYSVSSIQLDDVQTHPPYVHVPDLFVDPDISDHPRFQTAGEILAALPQHQQDNTHCFQVKILHTLTDKPTSPHYIILHDKLEGRDCYRSHSCTCGSGVRCGVPCRHFWAVIRGTTLASFHKGLVNDLWFKTAQKLAPTTVFSAHL